MQRGEREGGKRKQPVFGCPANRFYDLRYRAARARRNLPTCARNGPERPFIIIFENSRQRDARALIEEPGGIIAAHAYVSGLFFSSLHCM